MRGCTIFKHIISEDQTYGLHLNVQEPVVSVRSVLKKVFPEEERRLSGQQFDLNPIQTKGGELLRPAPTFKMCNFKTIKVITPKVGDISLKSSGNILSFTLFNTNLSQILILNFRNPRWRT